jgi:uracil-DNA glycosylase
MGLNLPANDAFLSLTLEIQADPENLEFQKLGWKPLFWVSPTSRIILISQAPGSLAQSKNLAWRDQSGKLLRSWLGLSEDEFYNPALTAVIPMDFYFPGKSKQGDLPPRQNFAPKWHPKILELLPNRHLKILIGSYAQKYYLNPRSYPTLTQNVSRFQKFLPNCFPLPHPSGRNGAWFAQNPWFATDVLPSLKEQVRELVK